MSVINLASKYSDKIDERFNRISQAELVVSKDYRFTGVQTCEVYSLPTVAMTDYRREGTNRYGTPDDLGTNVQELTVTRDRAFTFVIDAGDKAQTQMVLDAGKALNRQLLEVCVPEYDAYVFHKLAETACAKSGHSSTTDVTKSNAYAEFLAAQEVLGNANVPDAGRVCLCSYRFANLLKQDPAFMAGGELTQSMILKGILGEVDGVKVVRVPATRLPTGCDFILVHPSACCAPKQLESYKIHTDPPGISGWLVEGRIIYDAFVLNSKSDGLYYHGSALVE